MDTTGTTESQKPLPAAIDKYGELVSELAEVVRNILANRLEPILSSEAQPATSQEKIKQVCSTITNSVQVKNEQLADLISEIRFLTGRIEV